MQGIVPAKMMVNPPFWGKNENKVRKRGKKNDLDSLGQPAKSQIVLLT